MTYDEYIALSGGEEVFIEKHNYNVIVAKIQKITGDEDAEFPDFEMDIQEILRYMLKPGLCSASGVHRKYLKEGTVMLLVGSYDDNRHYFSVRGGAFPYSEERRQWALGYIQKRKDSLELGRLMKEQREKEIKQEINKWYSDKARLDLNQLISEADFIGIGQIVSGGFVGTNTPTFEIAEILKGIPRKKYTKNYFVDVKISGVDYKILREYEYSRFLESKTVVLFLKEVEIANPRGSRYENVWKPKYSLVREGQGIIPVFKENITKIKNILEK
jgi:hypothetical protein